MTRYELSQSNLTLNVEVTAGTSIENAAVEMQALANRIQIPVRYPSFNGVSLTAFPGGSPEILVENFNRELHSPHTIKFANSLRLRG